MSRPRLIWLGNSTPEPAVEMLDLLRSAAEVHVQSRIQHLLAVAQSPTTTPADFCIIHWEYAGQWSVAQLNELAQAWPLTSYVVVVGEWAISASRQGSLWQQAEQFPRDDFCIQIALGVERFLSELRSRQPLLTEHWDERTLRHVHSAIYPKADRQIHCLCDSVENAKFWNELLSRNYQSLQIDIVQSATDLMACCFDKKVDILLLDCDLPIDIIGTWMQAQVIQPLQTLLISSFWPDSDQTRLGAFENCWFLSKPLNLAVLAKILARNQNTLANDEESNTLRKKLTSL